MLEKIAQRNLKIPTCIIAQYSKKKKDDPNYKYSDIFDKYGNAISNGNLIKAKIEHTGKWIAEEIEKIGKENIILDITGFSNSLLFGVLDAISIYDRPFYIAYTEAGEYWPKKSDWYKIEADLNKTDPGLLSDTIDSKPWLYSNDNSVKMIAGHEGYDTAGYKRALIGFLTFKCARLASILMPGNYSYYHFINGVPRLAENEWRSEALMKINYPIIDSWPISRISTFGYRNTAAELTKLFFSEDDSFLTNYNVSLALLGSKLQTVGCWIISRICNSITIVTSVPTEYYPKAFSDGIGQSWVFPLRKPPL
jgi:hypothetical protein